MRDGSLRSIGAEGYLKAALHDIGHLLGLGHSIGGFLAPARNWPSRGVCAYRLKTNW
jgi:hypothetical protein